MTKIRFVRNDGELLTVDAMGYSLNFTRSIPILPVPVLGERYGVDMNMVSADFQFDVILADDDCSANSFQPTGASATIDFSRLKEDSGGTASHMMTGDSGAITVADLNNLHIEMETAYTNQNTTRKPVRILFDSSTTSHSKTNNPPITTVGIQSATTGALIASRIKAALESAAGQYTDQLTTDGGKNFTDAFTITAGQGFHTSAGNAKLTFTAKEKGFASNNDTPHFSTTFANKTPFFEAFAGGHDRTCKSAGDKLQDLIAYVGNASLAGVSGRPLGGVFDNPDDPNSILERDFQLLSKQTSDYIVGVQVPYNSIIQSTSANSDYVERNLIVVTGRTNADEQHSEANNLGVSTTFNPNDPYTGIHGTVVAMSMKFNAGENIYEGTLTFMPMDFMVAT